jgi:hypothetical protein
VVLCCVNGDLPAGEEISYITWSVLTIHDRKTIRVSEDIDFRLHVWFKSKERGLSLLNMDTSLLDPNDVRLIEVGVWLYPRLI